MVKRNWWYHTDNLGSSSYLTDSNGKVSHYYNYLPFGELFNEQNNSIYENVYKFNAKELDDASGLYYYSARYYDPKLSIFLSVDPLAEKYPNFNPYAYCYQNPVRYIDPTGMEGEEAEGDPRPKWLDRVLKGTSAHRALTQYIERMNPSGNVWRANKAVNAPDDITRPDLVYSNGKQAGVWELKPAPPAPSSFLAAKEAEDYAKALNKAKGTDMYKPGTSGGAPSPFNQQMSTIDEKTGNKFLFTITDPDSGAIFWTEIKNPKVQDPSPVDVPIQQPITSPNNRELSMSRRPEVSTPAMIGIVILGILGTVISGGSQYAY